MANRLTDIRVRRVSFVKKASTRDPQDPSKPRRFVLLKAESPPDERTDTMAAPTAETNAAQEIAKDLASVERSIAVAKAEGAPGSHIAQLERARGRIQKAYTQVDNPASLAAREKVKAGEHSVGGALAEFREAVSALVAKGGITRTAAMERVRRDDPGLERRVSAEERGAAITDS
jgi:hypothetical protein